jgi:type VII secretion protein EccE
LAARIAALQAAAGCLLLPAAPVTRAATAGTVAGLVALVSIRFRGRHLPEWLLARWRLRRRTRLSRGYRPRSPIGVVVPGADTRGHADRGGNRVGLLADGPSWTAMFRLDPIPDGVLVERLGGLLDELAGAISAGDLLIDAVQLVGWSVPASRPGRDGPAASMGGVAGTGMASMGGVAGTGKASMGGVAGTGMALRTFWVAARFLPGLHPQAVEARGGGEQGAIRAAAAAALRLATSLRQRGYRLRILDGAELTDELGTSLGLEPPPRGAGGRPLAVQGRGPSAKETWRSWSLGALHHACFRVRRPPRQPTRLAAMFTLLARPPAVTTCVSVLYSRDWTSGSAPRREVVVRVAVPADRNPRAVRRALRQAVSGLRGKVIPMNGEHLPGVRATIPLATAP